MEENKYPQIHKKGDPIPVPKIGDTAIDLKDGETTQLIYTDKGWVNKK